MMALHNFLAHGQPDARAFIVLFPVQALENIEYLFCMLGMKPCAIIPYFYFIVMSAFLKGGMMHQFIYCQCCSGDGNLRRDAGPAEFQGIGNQVAKQLRQVQRNGFDPWQVVSRELPDCSPNPQPEALAAVL
jgi:hypothetical protein